MASKRIPKKVLVGLIVLQGALVLLLFGVLLYLFRAGASTSMIAFTPLSQTELAATVAVLLPVTNENVETPIFLPPTKTPVFVATQPPTAVPTTIPTAAPLLPAGKLVFTCTPEKYNQICLLELGKRDPVRLTSRQANDYYPSFSPGGKQILFVSNKTGNFEIYRMNMDGQDEQQLTEDVGNLTAPELSPDGKEIVFASKWGSDSSIWLMPAGGEPLPVTEGQWNEIDPTWSPDGEQIAFASVRGGGVELFVMNKDGSDIHQVTQGVERIGGRSSWSPDGTYLVFYAGPQGDRDIYLLEIATKDVTRLTFGGNNAGPCFSPDGKWIVFSSSRDGDHEIFIIHPDGSGMQQLTFNDYDDWQPRWGP